MEQKYSAFINEFIDSIFLFYKDKEYKLSPNASLKLTKDPSLLFINSSMAVYKELLKSGTSIPDHFNVQDSFRTNNEFDNPNFLMSFKMLGNIGMRSSASKFISDIIMLLNQVARINVNDLYIVTPINENLIDLSEKALHNSNIIKIYDTKSAPHFSFFWKYGKGYPIIGEGLTFVYNDPFLEPCDENCSVLCQKCKKYTQLGNLILITNTENLVEYVEVGIGVERLLSIKYGSDIFSLPGIKSCSDKIMKYYEITEKNSKILINLYMAIYTLISQNILPSGKKHGYVLKKLIKILTDKLIEIFNIRISLENPSDEILRYNDDLVKMIHELDPNIFCFKYSKLLSEYLNKYVNLSIKKYQTSIYKKNKLDYPTHGISDKILACIKASNPKLK